MTAQTDVLVVGAGPTGLTLGAEFLARGVRCRLIDKEPARSDRSRALVVQARTLELLQKRGLAADLVARGRTTVRIAAYVGGRRVLGVERGDIGPNDTPYSFMLLVSQVETEQILEAQFGRVGAVVERLLTLAGFTAEADGVRARLLGPDGRDEVVRCRYLVGCDGAHSAVRKRAGLRFAGAPYPQDFLLADVAIDASSGVPVARIAG